MLHGGALGDVALALTLALRLPGVGTHQCQLALLSRSDPGDLSRARPSIRRRALDGIGAHWLYSDSNEAAPAALAECVSGARILSFLDGAGSGVHDRLARLGRCVYSVRVEAQPGSTAHITRQWEQQARAQGLLLDACRAHARRRGSIEVSAELREVGRAQLERSAAPPAASVVLIHPGSGGRAKCWPLEAFAETAVQLRSGGATRVAYVLGPVERERWPAERRERLAAGGAVVEPRDASELVGLLAAADLLLSNDCGAAHLAALVGTPTVTLFGPTDARVWGPRRGGAVAIQGNPSAGARWGISFESVAGATLRAARPQATG